VTAVLTRAVAAGALTCTQVGAIPALPTRGRLDAFLSRPTRKSQA
jgi:sugar/nucleoside kinase (ribokinase family)